MDVRVLCYSPYNRWALHGQWEMTILHGLRQRGAEVNYVLCDGLYSDCDVFWGAVDPRPPLACVQCQAEVTTLVASMGMDYEWLGRYLMPEERREARRWEQSLATEELTTATYGDWPVAEWIVGSVHSDLRRSKLDVHDPAVERAFRSYLFSGLVACFALDRLLDEVQPDVLLQFNCRQSSTRVAFELARLRDIRVVCHERGQRLETLQLTVDRRCTSLDPVRRTWSDWCDVPLSRDEIEAAHKLLMSREHGNDLSTPAFAPPPQPVADVRAALRLDPERVTWVLFTSADDELVAEEDWHGFFPTQVEWIERTMAFVAAHPELQLVVRVHPNTGSKRSLGANSKQLDEMEALRELCPANVRMVGADEDVSSYTLMEIGDVGLTYGSTAGLEMACKGKTVVVGAKSWLSGVSFVHTADEPRAYEPLLERLYELPLGCVSDDVRRLAYRFVYGQFFRLQVPFPLVRMSIPTQGTLAWSSTAQLQPGSDAGLDRCVGVILDDEPACRPPDEADRAHSEDDEVAFFAAQPRFKVLAFADELIDDVSLLAAWGGAFSAADAATLVIRTPPEVTEVLVDAVGRAGLGGGGTADLVAVDGELEALQQQVDAVFSRRDPGDALAGTPRFDDTSTDALRQLAGLGT